MRALLPLAFFVTPMLPASAQHHPFDWVVQEHYRSPSKLRSLTILPSQREGVAPALYFAANQTARVWSRDLPFTLRHAHIGDDGTVAGWGWASRWWESSDSPQPDTFVVLIGEDGEVRMHHELNVGFARARAQHAPTEAALSGVTHDPVRGRLLVRMLRGRSTAPMETWLAFDSGSKEPIALDPFVNVCAALDQGSAPIRHGARSLGSAAISGTPLTLAAWMLVPPAEATPNSAPSLLVALLDGDAQPVWTLEEAANGAEAERWAPMNDGNYDGRNGNRLLSPSFAPRLFSVPVMKTREVTRIFEVVPDSASPTGWDVQRYDQPGRAWVSSWKEAATPWQPLEPRWELEQAKLRELPAVELKPLGEIRLPRSSLVTLGADGRIFALCDEGPSLRAFQPDGVELWRVALPQSVWQPGIDCPSFSAHGDGTVWIGHRTEQGGMAFARFAAPGSRLPDGEMPASTPGVRVVAGADGSHWRLEQRGLFAMEGNPSKLRSIERSHFGKWLYDPTDAVFAADGSVLILVPPNAVSQRDYQWAGLNLFEPDGDTDAFVEMPPWVTRRTGIAHDGRHVVLAHDGSSGVPTPTLVLIGCGSSRRHVRLVVEGRHVPGKPFFAGKELWLHDGERITRFEVPPSD